MEFFFPEYSKNIEAESLAEAEKILFNELNNVWKSSKNTKKSSEWDLIHAVQEVSWDN